MFRAFILLLPVYTSKMNHFAGSQKENISAKIVYSL